MNLNAEEHKPLRVAIVGTGISGLSAGWLLAKEGVEVTLLERLDSVGMDAHCVTVEKKDGSSFRLNTPPRSFSRTYYPNLIELYRLSEVEIEPWSWSWVAFVVGSENPLLRMGRTDWFSGWSIPTYINLRQPWETLKLWRDGYRFSTRCQRDLGDPKYANLTLEEYVRGILNLSEAYIDKVLLPTLSMVCTCSYEACLAYPADLVMQFYARTSTAGQYRTRYGTEDAVRMLTSNVSRVLTSVRVQCIEPGSNGLPVVKYTRDASNPQQDEPGAQTHVTEETFDHVILATQANHGRYLINDEKLGRILESFSHEESQVVIHQDPVVMPQRREMWAPMSVGIASPLVDEKAPSSMFTIWMNDTYPDLKHNLFQTWNPVVDIDKTTVIDKAITFERPIMRVETRQALKDLEGYQGKNGIWFCGAWNAWRIPLQESGVISALVVAKSIVGHTPVPEATWALPEDDIRHNEKARNSEKLTTIVRFGKSLFVLAAVGSLVMMLKPTTTRRAFI